MCGSMVDIQSAAAEIRRGIKKKIEDRKKSQGKNIMPASATQCGHKKLNLPQINCNPQYNQRKAKSNQQTTVRSVHMCALHCAQLLHTILHRTDLTIFSLAPDNYHCSDDVYLREGEGGWKQTARVTAEVRYSSSGIGSRPSDHFFHSVCLSVCLFVQSFSQPSLIRFQSN